ncbi:importin-11-like [Augochlora pura]
MEFTENNCTNPDIKERSMDASVIEVLQQAGSQDPNILKPAEQTLEQWETERGFYTTLFNVSWNVYG